MKNYSEINLETVYHNLKMSYPRVWWEKRSTAYWFDSVSDAHDQHAILLHLVDKLHGQHATVKRLAEHLCSCIQSTSKPVPLEWMDQSYFSTETIVLDTQKWAVKTRWCFMVCWICVSVCMRAVLTMVSRPEVRHEMRSLPARVQTMVLCAPETAGPWSAVTIRHISMNWQAYRGNLNKNTATLMPLKVVLLVGLESSYRPALEPKQTQHSS